VSTGGGGEGRRPQGECLPNIPLTIEMVAVVDAVKDLLPLLLLLLLLLPLALLLLLLLLTPSSLLLLLLLLLQVTRVCFVS